MKRLILAGLVAGSLAGCQTLTPAQDAKLACVGATAGAAVASSVSRSTGAQEAPSVAAAACVAAGGAISAGVLK